MACIMSGEPDTQRLKRLAFQIMSQFPEDKADAKALLAILGTLLEWQCGAEATILPFVRLVTPEI